MFIALSGAGFSGFDILGEDAVSAQIRLQHIRYFLALAAERNFTRAATRCGVTQPSLTNAIKALERALGGRLFERGQHGCRLTALGASLRPHFEQLQGGLERVIRIAGSLQGAGTPRTRDLSSNRSRSLVTLCVAGMLACLAISGPGAARADGRDVEAAIREALPAPARCGRTTEPLFSCRYESPPEHSMVLDLSSGRDGPSASLTYNYDDASRFFGALGLPAGVFDACISQSQWVPLPISGRAPALTCYRVELGDRVTYEVLAAASDEAPILADVDR